MALIGSRASFEVRKSDRDGVCRECGRKWQKGDVIFVSLHNEEVVKIVCSDSCRETFDDRYWQTVADERERNAKA